MVKNWEKEKLLFTSKFSFSHSIFKSLVLQTSKKDGLFGKGLTDDRSILSIQYNQEISQLINQMIDKVFTSIAVDSVDMEMLSHDEGGRETTAENPHLSANMNNGSLQGYSSIETLLMNIQGLLKVAGENARQQERQIGKETYIS